MRTSDRMDRQWLVSLEHCSITTPQMLANETCFQFYFFLCLQQGMPNWIATFCVQNANYQIDMAEPRDSNAFDPIYRQRLGIELACFHVNFSARNSSGEKQLFFAELTGANGPENISRVTTLGILWRFTIWYYKFFMFLVLWWWWLQRVEGFNVAWNTMLKPVLSLLLISMGSWGYMLMYIAT